MDERQTTRAVLGVAVADDLGAILVLAAFLDVNAGLARLPDGMVLSGVIGIGMLAGIGFTLALFIGELGSAEAALVDAAKVGTLAASLIAGVLGFWLLRRRPLTQFRRDSTC